MHEEHRKRMREKFLSGGIDSLNPHEILEIILYYSIPRKNTNLIAHRLIGAFGSLSNVFSADIEDLKNIEGIGESSAVLIKTIDALSDIRQKLRWSEQPVLENHIEMGTYLLDMIGQRDEECFFLLCLDIRGKVISFSELEKGNISSSYVDTRRALECAIRSRAASVVLAHNHPTGTLIPSSSDIEITKNLQKAFEAVEISFTDHFIVGGGGFVSLTEKGYIL